MGGDLPGLPLPAGDAPDGLPEGEGEGEPRACPCCGCPLAVCPRCGRTFPQRTARRVYCSHQCACDVQNEAARQEALRRRPTAACKVCGETFKQKTRQHKYCSPKCKRRATYVRYDRFRHCERIKARTDLSDAEKERRIARIIGPVPEPSEEEIEARAAAERAKWNGAELKRRIVGPAPQ